MQSQKFNICFVTLGHISKQRGGIDRVTDVIGNELINRGHSVFMISAWKPHKNDIVHNYQFILPTEEILDHSNINFVKSFFLEKQINIIIIQSDNIQLRELIKVSKTDIPIINVVHNDPFNAVKSIKDFWHKRRSEIGLPKYILSFPLFFARQTFRYFNRRQYTTKKFEKIIDESNAVVFLSDNFKNKIIKSLNLNRSNQLKLYAIPNPISFSKADPDPKDKEKLVLYVGRLEHSPKRVDRLLNIWSKVDCKDWKLIIIGEGEERSNLEHLKERLNLRNVKFEGYQNPYPYYERASILCLTSTHEGFGLTLTEALQNGVIPVAFDSYESIHDIIKSGFNGFLIKPFKKRKYAQVLQNLIDGPETRKEITENILKDNGLDRFNVLTIVNKWEELFMRISN